jgi:hypothetical protein
VAVWPTSTQTPLVASSVVNTKHYFEIRANPSAERAMEERKFRKTGRYVKKKLWKNVNI